MKRAVLTLVCGAVLVAPLAGSAFASRPAVPHKICLEFPAGTPGTPDGYCLVVELPF